MACRSTCFLAAAVATLLGACTLEPHYHRPPPPVPALEAGAAGGPAAADIGWREFFPDPQLQQLIALALTDNRDLRVAVLNVQSAQAQYRIQRAELFPTINASAVEQVQGIPLSILEAEFPSGGAMTSASASRITSWTCSAASAA
jgi:multidrug efflux system outer membrane protein